MAAAGLVALGWAAWQELWAYGGDTPASWIDLTSQTLGQPADAGLRVFGRREPLVHALTAAGGPATVPPIDFGQRRAVLVATGPRSSTAYRLVLVRVLEERRRIVVRVREQSPSLAEPGVATLTFPFRLITIEQRGKPLKLEWEDRP